MNVGPFLAFSRGTGFPQHAQGNVSASILSELAFMGSRIPAAAHACNPFFTLFIYKPQSPQGQQFTP
jgi:hypothetical protein